MTDAPMERMTGEGEEPDGGNGGGAYYNGGGGGGERDSEMRCHLWESMPEFHSNNLGGGMVWWKEGKERADKENSLLLHAVSANRPPVKKWNQP